MRRPAPPAGQAYAPVAKDAGTQRGHAAPTSPRSRRAPDQHRGRAEAPSASRPRSARSWPRRRREEVQRGLTLVGPHRDELALAVGTLPVKGYASHGESWSFALALRLASYALLRADGDDPILILDDVFAELDTDRRDRLAELVAGAEQVLVTAAVEADVPAGARRRADPGTARGGA